MFLHITHIHQNQNIFSFLICFGFNTIFYHLGQFNQYSMKIEKHEGIIFVIKRAMKYKFFELKSSSEQLQ